MDIDLDVAIIGGGPGGSTCGGMLRKYDPELLVGIFEREQFPRDHVGESLLPPCTQILHELGFWDEVEAADFPIKIGATYRWGNSEKLWDFEFMPIESYREEARPRPWNDQTKQLALQVMSIGSGWIWFIPLGPTRTSIGYICPREYYRSSGKNPGEIYLWALAQEPLIAELTENAGRSGDVQATKDWSFVADRTAGENWFLVGEAAGFADPILAAGLTLTQSSAREAAYSILSMAQGEQEPGWLAQHYDDNQHTRIRQHIRFADFWYSANGNFTDLQAYTREIANDAGLNLDPKMAFQWLGSGGFTHDVLGQVGIGALDLAGTRQIASRFLGTQARWKLSKCNHLSLQLSNAEEIEIPAYARGKVLRVKTYIRGQKRLPVVGLFAVVIAALQRGPELVHHVLPALQSHAMKSAQTGKMESQLVVHHLLQALELMLNDGWVKGRHDRKKTGYGPYNTDGRAHCAYQS
jgi:2-polyprenyl-6-methoxyphenol hydroxylase-like FAD-dependent oxidoreductase